MVDFALFNLSQYLLIFTTAMGAFFSSLAMGVLPRRENGERFLTLMLKATLASIFALIVTSFFVWMAVMVTGKLDERNLHSGVIGCWVQIVQSPERPISLARVYPTHSGRLMFVGVAFDKDFNEQARWRAYISQIEHENGRFYYRGKGFISKANSPNPMFGLFEIGPEMGETLDGAGHFVDEHSDVLSMTHYVTYKVRCPERGEEREFLRTNFGNGLDRWERVRPKT